MRANVLSDADIVVLLEAADMYMCRQPVALGVWLAYTFERLVIVAEIRRGVDMSVTMEAMRLRDCLCEAANARGSFVQSYVYADVGSANFIEQFKYRIKLV